jgi:acyl dehydratase
VTVNESAIGKRYPAVSYEVGAEKIREYARAIGAANPVHHDREAARAEGFRDVVAPPMFCVVYSAAALGPAIFDPEVGINYATMLHGAQEFVWGEPVCAGDEIVTTLTVKDVSERAGMGFYILESISENQDGDQVVRGTWTEIVRGV